MSTNHIREEVHMTYRISVTGGESLTPITPCDVYVKQYAELCVSSDALSSSRTNLRSFLPGFSYANRVPTT